MDDLMTTEEVALMTRIKPGTLRYYRHIGQVGPKHFSVGRRVFYRKTDVEIWLNAAYESQQMGA